MPNRSRYKATGSIIMTAILLTACTPWGETVTRPLETTKNLQQDIAVSKAKEIFQLKKAQGTDMSNGPCLENDLMPDWVVDVAHDPRLAIDDKPENQCSPFREGKAHHFVELDTEGQVIKIN